MLLLFIMRTHAPMHVDHAHHAHLHTTTLINAGRTLVSARGLQTRPMMEKVRAAVFSMIQAQLGGVSSLPSTMRWLDLYAGVGEVVQALYVCTCAWCMHTCLWMWQCTTVLATRHCATGLFHGTTAMHNVSHPLHRSAISFHCTFPNNTA